MSTVTGHVDNWNILYQFTGVTCHGPPINLICKLDVGDNTAQMVVTLIQCLNSLGARSDLVHRKPSVFQRYFYAERNKVLVLCQQD